MLKTKISSRLAVYILGSALLFMTPFNVKGQSENKRSDLSLDNLKQLIVKHPDSLSYHKQFIEKFKKNKDATWSNQDSVISLIEPQYEKWIKQFPHSAIVPYAIGDAYASAESPKAKGYLLEAVKREPTLAEAWFDLSMDADRWGDFKKGRKYMGKAAKAEPDNPDYAFYYANSFSDSNPEKYRKMSMDVARRFPDSERGAQALYWLAYNTNNPKKKIKILERLRSDFPPNKFRWSASGMRIYYDFCLKEFPEKAVKIAREMTHITFESDRQTRMWASNLTRAQKLVKARQLLNNDQPKKALTVLKEIEISGTNLSKLVTLLRADAQIASDNILDAYNDLLKYYGDTPDEEVQNRLMDYGDKLDKSRAEVKQDIWQLLDKKAKPATEFKLKRYMKPGYATLSDFKGKIILLTYWFPGCGPCRGEFPHFQNVIDKFSDEQVAYIGINISPGQDKYVVPFMKASGYSFIPLHKSKKMTSRFAPNNFLIDSQGNIVFSHFRIDAHNEKELQLMVKTLLEKKSNSDS